MDQLRQSLGDDKLTYLGYSYGTTLGSTYAELFPDKVRALVLDGAVDPDADPKTDAEASAKALRGRLRRLRGQLRGPDRRLPDRRRTPASSSPTCWPRPATTPIPSSEQGETRKATAGRRA